MAELRNNIFLRANMLLLLAACLAIAWPVQEATAETKSTWWETARDGQAGHYWIKTDLPPDRTRELSQHLNLMYDAMSQRLGKMPQRRPERLNVLIFERRDDYLTTLMERYGVDARFTGGVFFYRGDTSALAIWTEGRSERSILSVLQHEAFHQFAYSRFGSDLPVWLNEGLAVFFGEAVLVGRDLIIGQTSQSRLMHVRAAIETGNHVPFRRIIGISSREWRDEMAEGRGRIQYDQAWSMVQFLIYGENGRYRQAFERYLWLLNENMSSERAFLRAFQTDNVDAFEDRWVLYARQARPSSFVTAMQRIEFLAEGTMQLSRRSVVPDSLDSLRDALREIEFTYTTVTHGVPMVLDAIDDEMFVIPIDDLARQQPVFTVTPAPKRRLSRRQQAIEDEFPTPPTIVAEHLRPRGLSIKWTRDRDDHTFSYEILVR